MARRDVHRAELVAALVTAAVTLAGIAGFLHHLPEGITP